MDARTVWFRETGEAGPKEQLLIETMFCVYYLSRSSAVLITRALQIQSLFARIRLARAAFARALGDAVWARA